MIVHVTGVHDTIGATVSVYVNVEVWLLLYHHANVVLLTNVGAVLSNLIAFDVTFVVLQFHAASHTFGVTLHVDAAHSVLIVHVTGVHDTIHILSVYVNVDI